MPSGAPEGLCIFARTGPAGAALLALPGQAQAAAGAAPDGLWLFASLALVVVAALAYALGRARCSPRAPRPADPGVQEQAEGDSAALQALMKAAPHGLQVFRRDPEGQWVPLPVQGGQPDGGAAAAPAEMPDSWREAALALAPRAGTTLGPWTLQRIGTGATERLLVWRHAAPAPAGPSPADDAAREAATLSYTVSHDLRAPLRVVEGFAKILKEDYGRQFDRIGNDHLDRVLAAAARMNTMIDAMLSLARLSSQPLARQPVDLSQLAHYIVEDLRRGSPQRSVEATIEPGLKVVGDPTLLRLVLENLLSNAWKYSARSEQARISLHCRLHDGRRVFEVRDNGAGFDMRQADRLFGLFQRLHSQSDFPGTGVGLASVQRIVRRHGGEIWADSAPGQGACFSFTLAD